MSHQQSFATKRVTASVQAKATRAPRGDEPLRLFLLLYAVYYILHAAVRNKTCVLLELGTCASAQLICSNGLHIRILCAMLSTTLRFQISMLSLNYSLRNAFKNAQLWSMITSPAMAAQSLPPSTSPLGSMISSTARCAARNPPSKNPLNADEVSVPAKCTS